MIQKILIAIAIIVGGVVAGAELTAAVNDQPTDIGSPVSYPAPPPAEQGYPYPAPDEGYPYPAPEQSYPYPAPGTDELTATPTPWPTPRDSSHGWNTPTSAPTLTEQP